MNLRRGARWFLPDAPDVLGMLADQTRVTVDGMNAFAAWAAGDEARGREVRDAEHAADVCKVALADAVREAFTTPIDPEDLFDLSRGLDEVLNGAKNAVRESEVMKIDPDQAMADMSAHLRTGVGHLHNAFEVLKSDRDQATREADKAIRCERDLEHSYRDAMSVLNAESDLRLIAGRRELYRRYSRIGDNLVRVAHRVWYSVVKEG